MRRVVWSETALADFERAAAYIAAESRSGAVRIASAIDETAARLGEMATGRPGRVEGTYEKPVARTPYIIAYALTQRDLVIVRVIHGARHWPAGQWPA